MVKQVLNELERHGLIDSIDSVKHLAVNAAHEISTMRARLHEEAQARLQEDDAEYEDDNDGDEGDKEEEENHGDDKIDRERQRSIASESTSNNFDTVDDQEEKQSQSAENSEKDEEIVFVAAPRADNENEDMGPRVEILD